MFMFIDFFKNIVLKKACNLLKHILLGFSKWCMKSKHDVHFIEKAKKKKKLNIEI